MRASSRLLAAGCMTLLAASWTLGADAVRWEPDFETAMQKAAQQNKLVLVHFWNDGCPPCVVVDREVFPSPQVGQAVHASYVPVKVHADRRADLARRYGVEQWPTDVFVAPSGQRVAAYISPKTPRDYSEMVSYIAGREQSRMAGSATQFAQAPGQMAPGPNQLSQAPSGQTATGRDSTFQPARSAPERGSYEIQAGGEFPLPGGSANPAVAQGGFPSPQFSGGGIAQQPFPPQQQANSAPPLMNPFSQNASPYGGIGAQPTANVAQNSAPPFNARSGSGQAFTPPASPSFAQGGLGNPALSTTSTGWPPSLANANAPAAPHGNAPAQVSQTPMNSPLGGSYQPPTVQPPAMQQNPAMQPSFGAGPPAQQAIPSQQPAPVQQAASSGPKFALDGYCVVSLVEQLHLPVQQQQWRKGDPRWGAVHRGQTYLFATQMEQQKFLANPDYYTPVLSGYDPVQFVEQGQLIEGRREYGFTHDGRIYMFSSEQNLQKFWGSRDMFINRVQQAMSASANQQRR